MAEEAKKVPVEESKDIKTVEAKTEDKKETKDTKVSDVLGKREVKAEDKDAKLSAAEAVIVDIKKDNKQMAKDLSELRTLIESGAAKKEVSTDLTALAEKHNVSVEFLQDFAATVRKEVGKDSDDRIKSIEETSNSEKREKIFTEAFDKTLEEMPEYKKLVSKDVIRTLVMDPKNSNKTFAQIFESSYGHLVTGKKTLEPTKARGGKEDTKVDISRAQKDTEYFKEVMADPELRKQYNEGIASRNRF